MPTVTDANLVLGRLDRGLLPRRRDGARRRRRPRRHARTGKQSRPRPRTGRRRRPRPHQRQPRPPRSGSACSRKAWTRAASACSPSAAPAACTRSRSRTSWASRAWSSRPTRARFPPAASCSRTSSTTWPAAGSCRRSRRACLPFATLPPGCEPKANGCLKRPRAAAHRLLTLSADMRYHGQAFELVVPWGDVDPDPDTLARLLDDFHALHKQRFCYAAPAIRSRSSRCASPRSAVSNGPSPAAPTHRAARPAESRPVFVGPNGAKSRSTAASTSRARSPAPP